MTASPTKLRDGSWGAKVQGSVDVGEEITIETRAGKRWTAVVTRVVWSGEGATIVATESTDRPAGRTSDPASCVTCGGRKDAYAIRRGYRRCGSCAADYREGGGMYAGGASYRTSDGRFVLGDDD
jgi:hypothetical protein